MNAASIADELERLCCAETEAKFFDYVTESVGSIIAELRKVERMREPCGECHLRYGEVCNICGRSHPIERPKGSNADEWHLFLVEHKDALPFVAVQIAEAIEQAHTQQQTSALPTGESK